MTPRAPAVHVTFARGGRVPSAVAWRSCWSALVLLGRLLAGGWVVGATSLLVVSCGLVLLPWLPRELGSLSIRVAVTPALGIACLRRPCSPLRRSSACGLGSVSIALVVAGFVAAVAAASVVRPPPPGYRARSAQARARDAAALGCVVAFAFSSSWDVAYPFQARGTDWGHYLLYADEVAVQRHVLIDDPFAGEPDRVFADPAAVGALYGSLRLVDGISSWSLTSGIVVVSALTVLSVFAAAAALWGAGPGLVAAGAYAVAPIRLDLMSWHGLGTAFALLFVPLVVLSLGLLFRGARGWQHVAFLALCLIGVTVSHATTAIVVFAMVALAPSRRSCRASRPRNGPERLGRSCAIWWARGVLRPARRSVAVTCVAGAGVIAHVWRQSRALGKPVSWQYLGPDWLSRASVEHCSGGPFLLVALGALVIVLATRRLRRDPALLAVASLALACLVVGQAWRLHVSYDYQRVVYYLGVGLVLLRRSGVPCGQSAQAMVDRRRRSRARRADSKLGRAAPPGASRGSAPQPGGHGSNLRSSRRASSKSSAPTRSTNTSSSDGSATSNRRTSSPRAMAARRTACGSAPASTRTSV